jgi:hypothetical protein
MIIAYSVGLDVAEKKQQPLPEPVLSKCDSLYIANDSLIQVNKKLEDRLLTYRLGLAQLKMVDKPAHDYLINAGNFKFIENWEQF